MAVYLTLFDVWSVPDAVSCNGTQVELKVSPGRYRMIEVPYEERGFQYGNRGPYWFFDPSQDGFAGTKIGYSRWFWEQWQHEAHGKRRVLIEIVPETAEGP